MQFSGEERRRLDTADGGSQYFAQGRLLYAVVIELVGSNNATL